MAINKNWRILTKLRTNPARATHLLRALLVLTNLEVQPLTDDLHRGLLPTTSMSAPRTGRTSPLTCDFKLAEAHCTALHRTAPHRTAPHRTEKDARKPKDQAVPEPDRGMSKRTQARPSQVLAWSDP
ncbi:hypothetical protein DWB77_00159 [Streptomyces hundungensis]|uniref:DDE Tnp4 domain-containing protein n=1 Tax=Streptomyces hundungensis TaxID=1077946 RepID=A0A387HBF1_9ACTN|nr:hypothetical protein DWB77_00159 [Streptomyces hundungensis]